MTEQEAKEIYQRVFVAFPGVREWLAKTENASDTFAVWCGVLRGVDAGDAATVVESVISGDRQSPPAYERDKWPQFIRNAANEIRFARTERIRVEKIHQTANDPKTASGRFMASIRESWRLGNAVRDEIIKRSENDKMVEELVSWSEHSGEKPWFVGKPIEAISKHLYPDTSPAAARGATAADAGREC